MKKKLLLTYVPVLVLVFLFAKTVWPTNLPAWAQGSKAVNTLCDQSRVVCVRVLRQRTGGLNGSVHTTLTFGGSAYHRFSHGMRIIQFESVVFPDIVLKGEDLVITVGGITTADELILTKEGTDLPVNVVFDTAY